MEKITKVIIEVTWPQELIRGETLQKTISGNKLNSGIEIMEEESYTQQEQHHMEN